MEENMKKQIDNNDKELESLRRTYEEKLADAKRQVKPPLAINLYLKFISILFSRQMKLKAMTLTRSQK